MSQSGPGRREVAYRLFAAEFEDAEFSYSESDEERAPNYVVTPTGARVNRLFAVGVLTAVDDVNPEMVRGRVVDPTGAFVTYAGQYQPEALAFLERAEPPSFLALSGKARTFQPDDGDRVYTSVRPESVSEVSAETRDRWVVTTAERTLERVGIVASALESELTGDRLRVALEDAGVDDRLADGVALAIEYYGTTPAYLDALRTVALEAVRVVAGDLEEVGGLELAPDDGAGSVDAASLATLTLEAPDVTESAEAGASDPSGTSDPSGASDDESTESRDASTTETAPEPTGGSVVDADVEPDTDTDIDSGSDADTDIISDAAGDAVSDQLAVADGDATAEEPGEFDPGEFELDEDEREAVEEEYGTEFSTADEVESPAEDADAEQGADAVGEPTSTESTATEVDTAAEADELDVSTDETGADVADEPTGTDVDHTGDADADPAEETDTDAETDADTDGDIEATVVETMDALDEGDGADREAVVAAVVDASGVDPADVESAIQDALMGGRCYEPSDGVLKSI